MRITKVSVKKLFGIFDHDIPMHDSRITIIHGPNGFGKTVLLTMVHGLFNSRYKVFSDVPFEEFRVEFENDEEICIRRDDANQSSRSEDDNQERDDTSQITSDFTISHSKGGKAVDEPYIPKVSDGSEFNRMASLYVGMTKHVPIPSVS